jgi:predicted transcriptional regulator of viral defense system
MAQRDDVLDFIETEGEVTPSMVAEEFDIDRKVANNMLSSLVRSGKAARVARGVFSIADGVVLPEEDDVTEEEVEDAEAALDEVDFDLAAEDAAIAADRALWLASQFNLDLERVLVALNYYDNFVARQ